MTMKTLQLIILSLNNSIQVYTEHNLNWLNFQHPKKQPMLQSKCVLDRAIGEKFWQRGLHNWQDHHTSGTRNQCWNWDILRGLIRTLYSRWRQSRNEDILPAGRWLPVHTTRDGYNPKTSRTLYCQIGQLVNNSLQKCFPFSTAIRLLDW